MNTVITKEEQDHIIGLIINVLDEIVSEKVRDETCHYLFLGARIALGHDRTPPHWIVNLMCMRTDRMITDYEASKKGNIHDADTHILKEI